LTGSIVALVTPFTAAGELDLDAWRRLIGWHLATGTDGIVVAGTTGESATLEPAEFERLLAVAASEVKGRVPLLAGAGSPSTAKAIDLAQRAKAQGADGILAVTPYYNRPSQAGLAAHYRALAAACDLPLVLYNVPGRCGVDLQPKTVESLLDLPNLAGIKEANTEPGRLAALLAIKAQRPSFAVLSGDDATAAASLLAGADGVISVIANAAPGRCADWAQAARRGAMGGDRGRALELDRPLQTLTALSMLGGNPAGIKWCLHRMGQIGPALRLPLVPLAGPEAERAEELFVALGGLLTLDSKSGRCVEENLEK